MQCDLSSKFVLLARKGSTCDFTFFLVDLDILLVHLQLLLLSERFVCICLKSWVSFWRC